MARTAKKSFSNDVASVGVATLPAEDQPEDLHRPVIKVAHREVRTWEEKKTIDDVEDEDFEDSEDETEADDLKIPDDPIARVVNEIATSRSTWTLQVNRLQNYERDNRTDPKSRRHCGILSIPDADYLKEERYLEDLQAKFARGQSGNWFYLCVRRDNRNHSYLPPVCVEPPLPEMMAAKAAEASGNGVVNVYTPQTPTIDGFKQFVSQAKQFAEIRDLLLPAGFQQPQTTQVANGEAPTAEQALLTLMNVDNTVVDTVASKLKGLFRSNNGGGEPERSWIDVVYIAIERDTLPKLINQFLPTALPRQQSAPTQQPTAQPEQQPQTVPPDQAAYERLMQLLLQSMRINGDVEPVLIAIDGFVALFPEHGPMVNSFVNAPPEMLLPGLAQASPAAAEIVALPHAKEWIEKLKAAYFPEDGEDKE